MRCIKCTRETTLIGDKCDMCYWGVQVTDGHKHLKRRK